MHRRDDDEIQELEFDAEPAETPPDWEDEAPVPEDDGDDAADEDSDPLDGESTDEPDREPDLRADVQTEQAEPALGAQEQDEDDGPVDEPVEPTVHPATRWVPLSELHLEYKYWQNPRSVSGLDDTRIGALASSITRGTTSDESGVRAGIKDPLEVIQIVTGIGVINLVIDGQRRCLAAKYAKLGDHVLMPVVDLEPEPVKWTAALSAQCLAHALDKVGTREGLSSFELSENAERLRSNIDPDTAKEYTLAGIAATVGRSESWVSKILAARDKATPALLLSWKKGDLTDEQFKDLAEGDKRAQKKAAATVVEARSRGDLTGARTLAKEQRALAAAAKAADSPEPKAKIKKGEQSALDLPPPKKAPPLAVVEDMLNTAVQHPPTHDYVKGMMDALKWDRGLFDASNFAKPWKTYMERIADSKATKPTKKAKK